MVQVVQQPEPNPEFAAILNQAREVDDAATQVLTGQKPEAAPVEVLDPVAAWAEIPALVGQMLCMVAPELKPVYSPEACRQWGEAMNRLAIKRGWSADGLPPEVTVVLTSAMFVIPTAAVIKQRRATAQRARESQENAAVTEGAGSGA